MFKHLKNDGELLWDLAKNDFKTKYAGSYFGVIWAFVQPIITILVYWLVFEYGLRVGSPIEGTPYVLWFMTGIIPWFFFSEVLNSGANCLREYDYLVKKVIFPIKLLPIVKLISSLFVHLVFLGFLAVIYVIYGRIFTIHLLRLIYFSICLSLFSLGLIYISSAIIVFFKDLGQIINVVLQVGMWATPILWNYKDVVPQNILWIFKMNPMFYIIEGYRNSMLGDVNLIFNWIQMLYNWIVIGILLIGGVKLFNKLEVHFADVL